MEKQPRTGSVRSAGSAGWAGSAESADSVGSVGSVHPAGPARPADSVRSAGPVRSAVPARSARPASGGWQWGRTAHTQRALLDAAREVFTSRGFADASIADVVERAGSSVGSLYHHFGGKSELFIALWQEHQLAHEQAASKAVADARKAGVTDPGELFAAGARAFLQGSWERRDLALLFLSGDGPPGFEVMQRQRSHEWVGQNDALLHLPDTALDRLYASVLTSLIGEGAREVATSGNPRQANKITDAVIEYARRLMAGGPSKPGGPGGRRAGGVPRSGRS